MSEYQKMSKDKLKAVYDNIINEKLAKMSKDELIESLIHTDKLTYQKMPIDKLIGMCREKKTKGLYKLKKDEMLKLVIENSVQADTAETEIFDALIVPVDTSKASTKKVNKLSNSSKKAIPKRVRDELWRLHSESLDGTCYVCDGAISFDKFEAGHVIAKSKGGSNNIDNLKPICSPCNKSMGMSNMEEFKEMLKKSNKEETSYPLGDILSIILKKNPPRPSNMMRQTFSMHPGLLRTIEHLECAANFSREKLFMKWVETFYGIEKDNKKQYNIMMTQHIKPFVEAQTIRKETIAARFGH